VAEGAVLRGSVLFTGIRLLKVRVGDTLGVTHLAREVEGSGVVVAGDRVDAGGKAAEGEEDEFSVHLCYKNNKKVTTKKRNDNKSFMINLKQINKEGN